MFQKNESEPISFTILLIAIVIIIVNVINGLIIADEWNDGVCSTCSEQYELRAVYAGMKYYACPECGNEVRR